MKNELTVKQSRSLSLKQMVDIETKNRAILTDFIAHHMKDGVDYGRIHFSKQCPNRYTPSLCKVPAHFSKDCLFKPGSEKFASLMKLTIKFHKDTETWEMAGSKPGLFCYVCELVNAQGLIIGEGRGAADITEKEWSMNNAIKIAQKRSQIDAVLRTGGLSDFFTQDLEDASPSMDKEALPSQSSSQAPTNTPLASEKQHWLITKLLHDKGKTAEDLEAVCKSVFNKRPTDITLLDASEIIKRLQALPDPVEDGIDIDEVADALEAKV